MNIFLITMLAASLLGSRCALGMEAAQEKKRKIESADVAATFMEKGHEKTMRAFAMTNNRDLLFSGSQEGTIKIWRPLCQGADEQIWNTRTAAFADPTLYFALLPKHLRDEAAQVIPTRKAPKSYKCIAELRQEDEHPHDSMLHCLCVDSDDLLYTAGIQSIKIWRKTKQDDPSSYSCIAKLTGHDWTIQALLIDSQGVLFSAGYEGTIKIWKKTNQADPTSYVCVATLKAGLPFSPFVESLCMDRAGRLFAGYRDGSITVWQRTDQHNPLSYECKITLKAHEDIVCALDIDEQGRLFSGAEHYVKIWQMTDPNDVATYQWIHTLNTRNELYALRVVGENLFIGSWGVQLWKMTKPRDPLSYKKKVHLGSRKTTALFVDPDEIIFSGEGEDRGVLRIWARSDQNDPMSYDIMAATDHFLKRSVSMSGPEESSTKEEGQFLNIDLLYHDRRF